MSVIGEAFSQIEFSGVIVGVIDGKVLIDPFETLVNLSPLYSSKKN